MNILVIGNGFDLAHGLPTKYTDFLAFCWMIKMVHEADLDRKPYNVFGKIEISNKSVKQDLEKLFENIYKNRKEQDEAKEFQVGVENPYKKYDEFYNHIKNNVWIDYFFQCNMQGKENWIDFESEISDMIQSLDADMHRLSGGCTIDDDINDLSNKFLYQIYSNYTYTVRSINVLTNGACEKITFKKIRNRLLKDLNKLIRALEIYLTEYVEKMDIKVVSPDIEDIAIQINSDTHTALSAKVLSFNYTNTFEKIYDKSKRVKYDYIHGKANSSNTIESNNIVLGIDEYLGKKRRNKEVEFIAFKKFYQRIHKQTGCKYKKWVDEIKQDYFNHLQKIENLKYKELQYIPDKTQRIFNTCALSVIKREKCQVHNLYIFGHSLDATDGDILKDLILNDNVHTTIYYHNKDVMGQQIANLVKVIGQDELIKRTGGNTKTIEFKQQQNMVERKP